MLAEPNLEMLLTLQRRASDQVRSKRLKEVIRLTKERRLESAYHLIKQALLSDPHDLLSHYVAGRLARVYGDLVLAKSHYIQALYAYTVPLPQMGTRRQSGRINLDDHTRKLTRWISVSLMKLLSQCDQRDELRALIKWRLTVDEHSELFFMRGKLEERSNRLDLAVHAYESALLLDETSHLARLSIARVRIELNDLELAEEHLVILRKELPKSDRVWSLSGHLSLSRGEIREGLRSLKRAIRYNKRCSLAHRALGDHFAETHPWRSIKYYSLAQGGDAPTYDLYEKLARVYERLGRYDDAISQLSLLRYFIPIDRQAKIQGWIRELQATRDQERDDKVSRRSPLWSRWF